MTVDPLALVALGVLGSVLVITIVLFAFVMSKLGKKSGAA